MMVLIIGIKNSQKGRSIYENFHLLKSSAKYLSWASERSESRELKPYLRAKFRMHNQIISSYPANA